MKVETQKKILKTVILVMIALVLLILDSFKLPVCAVILGTWLGISLGKTWWKKEGETKK